MESGYRNVYRVVRTCHGSASRTLRFGYADDAEIDVAYLYISAEGVFGAKKVSSGRRSEYGDLGSFFDVGFGHEHSVLRLDVLNFGIVASNAIYGRRSVDGSYDDLFGSLRYGRNRGHSGKRTDFFDVVDSENVGTFYVGRADVALAVSSRTKREEIGAERLDVGLNALLRAFAESEKHDYRSHADDDSETRKSRAHLIGTDTPEGVEQMFY